MSMGKTLYPLYGTQVKTRKTGHYPEMNEKLMTGTVGENKRL